MIVGKLLPELTADMLVQVAVFVLMPMQLQEASVPVKLATLKPVGKVSVMVVVPEVGPSPPLLIVTSHSPVPNRRKVPVWDFVTERLEVGVIVTEPVVPEWVPAVGLGLR